MRNFDVGQIDLGGAADIDGFLSSETGDSAAHVTGSILQKINVPDSAAFELSAMETQPAPGLDALFEQQPTIVEASSHRKRVASVADLKPFVRVSTETLIHKSQRDLWTIRKESDGQFYIERLFDDNGEPLKG
jgi:hypothetical protein